MTSWARDVHAASWARSDALSLSKLELSKLAFQAPDAPKPALSSVWAAWPCPAEWSATRRSERQTGRAGPFWSFPYCARFCPFSTMMGSSWPSVAGPRAGQSPLRSASARRRSRGVLPGSRPAPPRFAFWAPRARRGSPVPSPDLRLLLRARARLGPSRLPISVPEFSWGKSKNF